jgi:membrane protease YdiL (CAAX protease family)
MLLAFALLGLSICSAWLPPIPAGAGRSIPPWVILFLGAVLSGLCSGLLAWPALLALAGLGATAWASQQPGHRLVRGFLTATAALLALALAFHLVPGFSNPVFARGVQLSADAAPIILNANFDKGAAGLFLLVFFCRRATSRTEWRALWVPTFFTAAITTVVVIGIALAAGYVRPDMKLPSFTLAHLVKTLLWTCVLEEAFFRGLLQERLMRAVQARPAWQWLPVTVSSLAFGLAHAGGGMTLMALATVAGLGYSLAYASTRRIEAAVLTHFTLNTVHFLGFTYPHVAP